MTDRIDGGLRSDEPTRTAARTTDWRLVVLVALLGLAPAEVLAAQLKEVRVGRHPDFTRVVLETDTSVAHTLSRTGARSVRIELSAGATPRTLTSKSELLSEVVVETTPSGSVARLDLARDDVEVVELVLRNPPRIVIDLRPAKPGAEPAALATATTRPEPARPAVEPAPKPEPKAEPKPEPKPEPKVASEPEARPEKLARAPRVEDSAGEATLAARAEDAPDADAAPEEAVEPAPPTEAASEEAASEPPNPLAGARELPSLAKQQPAPAKKKPMPVPPAPRAPAGNGGAFSFLPAPLDEPAVLGGIAALVALVGGWIAVRRRGSRAQDEAASPFARDDSPFEATGPPAGVVEAPAAPREPSLSSRLTDIGSEDSIFGGGGEAEPEEDEKEVAPVAFGRVDPVPGTSVPSSPAPIAAGGDVMRIVEEMEKRLSHLETRLEEVVDAKERLERQVSAQTEELRVQRAAIARTQRVLRSVSRPEDEATEPAPKL